MKVLKVSFFAILTTSILITLVLGFAPHWVVNKSTINISINYFTPELDIDLNQIEFDLSPRGFLKGKLSVAADELCFEYEESIFCFDTFDVKLRYNLLTDNKLFPESLHVLDKKIDIQMNNIPSNDPVVISDIIKEYSSYVQWVMASPKENVNVLIDDIDLHLDGESTEVVLGLNSERIEFEIKEKETRSHIKAVKSGQQLWIGTIQHQSNGLDVKSVLRVELAENGTLDLKVDEININRGALSVSADAHLKVNSSKATLELNGIEAVESELGIQFLVKSCAGEMNLEKPSEWHDLTCDPIVMKTTKNPLSLVVGTSIELRDQLIGGEEFVRLIVKIKEVDTGRGFEVQIAGEADVKVIYKKEGGVFARFDKFDFDLMIPSFSQFAQKISDTKFAIPSPLNSLKGRMGIKTVSFKRLIAGGFTIGFTFELNLDEAKHNQVKLTGDGSYEVNSEKTKLNIDVSVSKFYVYLPKIDPIRGLPQIQEDGRIKPSNSSGTNSDKKDDFQVNIKIQTELNDSIRIFSSLFKPYLAIGLKLKISETIQYSIVAKEDVCNLVYLKRSVNLRSLSLDKEKDTNVKLKLMYHTGGYDLFLNVHGTMDDPYLKLSSDPSLPKKDIVSLLLYNRKAQKLTPFQRESVGGTEAAIKDRTLGLFSIWAFASTPIESVSYNAANRTYSAQVALPGEVNFSIGTDWENINNLTLRKNIRNGWAVVTSYLPGIEGEDSGNLFLQKEISY